MPAATPMEALSHVLISSLWYHHSLGTSSRAMSRMKAWRQATEPCKVVTRRRQQQR
jgi:hypothetical protein